MQLTLNIRLDWLKKWAKLLILCVGLCPHYGLISNLHMIAEYSKPVEIDIECTHIYCQTHTTPTQNQNEEFDTISLIFMLEWLPLWCVWTCIFDRGSGLVWFSTTCLNKVLVRIIISVFYSCTNWKLNVEMHRSHKGLHDVFFTSGSCSSCVGHTACVQEHLFRCSIINILCLRVSNNLGVLQI